MSWQMIIDRLDEEFLLFATHRDGSWVSRRHGSVRFGMAGAWLLEMLRDGKIRQVGTRVVSKSKTPMDDAAIDPLLEVIYRAKRPKHVTDLLRIFAGRAPQLIPAVARRLRGRGYIDIVVDARGRERYPAHRPESRQMLREHLWAVLQEDRPKDLPSIDLLCVLGAAGMTEEVFGPGHRTHTEERIQQLIRFDPHLLYMWKAVRRVRRWGRLARPPAYEVPEVHFESLGESNYLRPRDGHKAMPPWRPPEEREC